MSGELVPIHDSVRIIAAPHPLRMDAVQAVAPHGLTIAEMLGNPDLHAHVWIGDRQIPREQWALVRPAPGSMVTVRVIPAGRDMMGPLLMIAVMVAAIAAPYALGLTATVAGVTSLTTTGMIVSAGIGIVGSLLVSALVPPVMPKQGSRDEFRRLQSLTGTRNQIAAYNPIPRVYGTHQLFPPVPMTALPYTELVGSDQYLRMLVCLGYGPLQIGGHKAGGGGLITHETELTGSPIRIGDTAITEFEDVEFEIGDPDAMTLYTDQIVESQPGWVTSTDTSDFDADDDPAWIVDEHSTVRTTDTGAVEISIDVAANLFSINKKGKTSSATIEWRIEYRPTGSTGAWQVANPLWEMRATKRETTRMGYRWKVEEGQYDVRLTRLRTFHHDFEATGNEATWAALRTIREGGRPFDVPGTVVMALRIKATDQINGTLDTLNVVATSILPAWNGTAWVEQPTDNPAWVYADILTGNANPRPAAKSRLLVDDLADWAAWCEAESWKFNAVFDSAATVFERARDVAAAGRAAWAIHDGKITVVRDTPQAVPVAMLTPRNSWGFRAERIFPERPHALQVQFIDTVTWQETVRTVYDDGYDETNATRFERLETVGVTDPEQAWKIGRYHLAQLRLRPETFTVHQDIEHIVYRRGDLVRLAHDVLLIGSGWGRVKSVTLDGATGDVASFVSDEELIMDGAKSYAVRVRRQDGTMVLQPIQTVAGVSTTITPTAPIPGIQPGDLFLYGVSDVEDIDCKVVRIEPRADMSAQVTLVHAAHNIEDALTGDIPPFDPAITEPIDPSGLPPRTPIITSIRSDATALIRDADGSPRLRILVAFRVQPGIPGLQVQARWRPVGDTGEWDRVTGAAEAGVIAIEGVEAGGEYVIQLRSADGPRVSAWTMPPVVHTVVGKERAPGEPTFLTVTGGIGEFGLTWVNPEDGDLAHINVVGSPVNDRVAASAVTYRTSGDTLTVAGFPAETTRYWWVQAVDTSGNVSNWHPFSSTGGVSATTRKAERADIADDIVEEVDKITDMSAAIDALEETYGDTAAAAASAAAAAQSAADAAQAESDAVAARAAAIIAQSAAEGASAEAIQAKVDAVIAQAAAEGASVEAIQAKADAVIAQSAAEGASAEAIQAKVDAVIAKSAAEGASADAIQAKVDAVIAQGAAEGASADAIQAKVDAELARDNAGNSATAADSFKTAAESAKTLAEGARDTAQNHASAAGTHATNAATSASDAASAATSATTARNQAQAAFRDAVLLNGNPTFEEGLTGWSATPPSGVRVANDLQPHANREIVDGIGKDGGRVLRVTDHLSIFGAKATSVDTSRTYRVFARVRRTHLVTPSVLYVGFTSYDADLADIATRYNAAFNHSLPVTEEWQEFTGIISGIGNGATQFPTGTAYARPMARFNYKDSGSVDAITEVDELRLEDITESVAAAGSATAAATSASQASGYADDAESAATASNNAKVAAESARDTAQSHATAAAGSASTASTHATNAGNSASAANTAKVAAESAKGDAEAARDTAQDHRATALIHANAAGTSASNAATSATDAASAATSATTAKNEAEAVYRKTVMLNRNANFAEGQTGWSNSIPSGTEIGEESVGFQVLDGVGVSGGRVLRTTGPRSLYASKPIPVDTSRVYRISGRVRKISHPSSGTGALYLGVNNLQPDFTSDAGGNTNSYAAAHSIVSDLPADSQWRQFSGLITGEGTGTNQFRPGTAWVRPVALFNYNSTGGVQEIDELLFEDVTDSVAANNSAQAAATSASNAATYADEAETAATASTNAKVSAESARDTAQGHATTATNQASAAAGSASSAATHATNAGNSATAANSAKVAAESARDAASGHATTASDRATAASTSASDAATSATDAATAASAANTSRLQAESARDTAAGHATTATNQASAAASSADQASTYADDAETAATASTNAKVAAESARDTAQGAATTATNQATAASTSASDAATSATDAGNSATAANSSRVAAESAKTAAETAKGAAETARTQAQNSATAAATSATNAGTAATDAASAAAAANTSALTAASEYRKTVLLNRNANFEEGLTGWSPTPASGADVVPDLAETPTRQIVDGLGKNGGKVLRATGSLNIFSAKPIPVDTGRVYRVLARVRRTHLVTPSTLYVGILNSAADRSHIGYSYAAALNVDVPVSAEWQEFSALITGVGTGNSTFRPDTVYARAVARLNYVDSGAVDAVMEADELSFEDVTESIAASNASQAAATSASNAATYADDAETAATASTNAKVAAESARDAASGHATTATNQASAAAGSASSAATHATNAGNSATAANTAKVAAESARDAASGHAITATNQATAASTSASNAATSATDAGTAATAANTAKLAAESARDVASGHAGAALSRASAAADSADQAATYADDAETAATASSNAKLAAESARDAAQGAATTATNQASAAATSAGSAATQATNAGNSAAAANTAKLAAESARDTAQGAATTATNRATAANTSASNAATSATNAGNSASAANNSRVAAESAKTAAETAKGAAETARTQAQNSATAAATSATNAGTAASDAASAATSATTARNEAASVYRDSVILNGNFAFDRGLTGWTLATGGAAPPDAPETSNLKIVDGVGQKGGRVLEATGRTVLYSISTIPVDTTKVYRVKARLRQTVDRPGAGFTSVSIGILPMHADYTLNVGNRYCAAGGVLTTVAAGWIEVEGLITGVGAGHNSFPAGTTYMRAALVLNDPANQSGGTAQVDYVEITDVTESQAAAGSAEAAATSASQASSYADDAESAATASNSAKVAAESARNTAQGHATAASNSASTATTKASEASSSASAASASATTAQTQAGLASTSASNAASSATTAGGHASAASTSATNAANSASAAGTSATQASTSAGNAANSATTAGNHATTALGHANAASMSAATASDKAIEATNSATVAARVVTAGFTTNPVFADWPSGQNAPTGWATYGVVPTRTSAFAHGGGYGVRFAVGAVSAGIETSGAMGAIITNLTPGAVEYVVVECTVYLSSGGWSGSGITMFWPDRVDIAFSAEFPVEGAGYYTLRKVIKRPPPAGAFSPFWVYLFANNAALGALSSKNITFTRFVLREASAEERRTFNVGDEISAAVSVESSARASAIGDVEAKYTVKVDTHGYISGFGLIGTANDATPSSEFFVLATRFKVAAPGVAPVAAFVVDAGNVYIDTAFIRNLTGENFAAETVLANKSIHVGSAANGAGVSLDGSTGTIVSRYANGNVAARIGPSGTELVRFNKPNGTLALRATTTAFELGTGIVPTGSIVPDAISQIIAATLAPWSTFVTTEYANLTRNLGTITTTAGGSGKVVLFWSPLDVVQYEDHTVTTSVSFLDQTSAQGTIRVPQPLYCARARVENTTSGTYVRLYIRRGTTIIATYEEAAYSNARVGIPSLIVTDEPGVGVTATYNIYCEYYGDSGGGRQHWLEVFKSTFVLMELKR